MRHLSDDDLDIIGIYLDERILAKLDRIERLLVHNRRETHMDLTALTAAVDADTDAVNAASTLLSRLAQELRDAQDDPAAIAALADQLETNNASLSAAVVANTPAGSGGTVDTGPTGPTGPGDTSATGTPDDGVSSNDGGLGNT